MKSAKPCQMFNVDVSLFLFRLPKFSHYDNRKTVSFVMIIFQLYIGIIQRLKIALNVGNKTDRVLTSIGRLTGLGHEWVN